MASMRNIQIRQYFNSLISKDTLELMKERDNLQNIASTSGDKDSWLKFKKVRNTVNNRLKYEENLWKKNRLLQCNSNSKKSWKTMKSILNWHSSGAPSRLFHNGILYTKSQEIADTQNRYFLNKIKEI